MSDPTIRQGTLMDTEALTVLLTTLSNSTRMISQTATQLRELAHSLALSAKAMETCLNQHGTPVSAFWPSAVKKGEPSRMSGAAAMPGTPSPKQTRNSTGQESSVPPLAQNSPLSMRLAA